jgi:hypothetical protein
VFDASFALVVDIQRNDKDACANIKFWAKVLFYLCRVQYEVLRTDFQVMAGRTRGKAQLSTWFRLQEGKPAYRTSSNRKQEHIEKRWKKP